jgi:hypothetical protein
MLPAVLVHPRSVTAITSIPKAANEKSRRSRLNAIQLPGTVFFSRRGDRREKKEKELTKLVHLIKRTSWLPIPSVSLSPLHCNPSKFARRVKISFGAET